MEDLCSISEGAKEEAVSFIIPAVLEVAVEVPGSCCRSTMD